MVSDVVAFRVGCQWHVEAGQRRVVVRVKLLRELGWSPRIGLRERLADAYADFLAEAAHGG